MSWKRSRFASSLMSLWGDATPTHNTEDRIQLIRQTMLDSLKKVLDSPQKNLFHARLLYSTDVQTLWYLRSDLMTMLAEQHGESSAKAQIEFISAKFVGLLPLAQKARPSRFHR